MHRIPLAEELTIRSASMAEKKCTGDEMFDGYLCSYSMTKLSDDRFFVNAFYRNALYRYIIDRGEARLMLVKELKNAL